MPAFVQALMSNPSAYSRSGNLVQTAAGDFTASSRTIRTGMATASATWKGPTSERADKVTGRFTRGVDDMASSLRTASRVLTGGGSTMQTQVTALRTYVRTTQSMGYIVLPGGIAVPGPPHYAQATAAGPAGPAVLQTYFAISRVISTGFTTLVNTLTIDDLAVARALQAATLDLDAAIPFRSSLRAPVFFRQPPGLSAAQRRNFNNRRRGEVGEQLTDAWLGLRGQRTISNQARLVPDAAGFRPGARVSPNHMRADHITTDNRGGFDVRETKTGGARVSPAQAETLPRVRHGGPVFDSNAGHIPRGTAINPGEARAVVHRWDIDSLPPSVRDALNPRGAPARSVDDVLAGRAGTPQARQDLLNFMSNPAHHQIHRL